MEFCKKCFNGGTSMKKYILVLLCIFNAYGKHSRVSKIAFATGSALGNAAQCAALVKLSNINLFSQPEPVLVKPETLFSDATYFTPHDYFSDSMNTMYSSIMKILATFSFYTAFYSTIIPFIDLDQAIENNTMSHNEFPLVSLGKGFIHGLKKHPLLGFIKFMESIQATSMWTTGDKPTETFACVAGAHQAKKELQKLVEYLKNPKTITRLGGKMNKGFLLVGDPGNGKTLLARAVAGEANCSFFHANGGQFDEMYVGVGAARIRRLFYEARKAAPSIIFIDEIDGVGGKRQAIGLGNNDYAKTLNQLLVEMDGFEQDDPDKPVIIIGATNRADVLDAALLRPGRFDRHITVPYPDSLEREEILTIYCKKIILEHINDIKKIAKETSSFSGANLANLVNQATLLATNDGSAYVTYNHFKEAQKIIRAEINNTSGNLNFVIPEETFDSVIGAQEAKTEMQTIISFLKDPETYARLGAKISHGILLEGNPGTGKTLLARAVAGEAQCSFFKLSGSDFHHKWIGEGPDFVKNLFKEARNRAPSIIFIDEIDAIAGNRDHDQNTPTGLTATLNQLLVEMDGFAQDNTKPVIVMCATNRPEVLDPAILRPGRLDRKIVVSLPDITTRKEMLEFYCKKIKTDPALDITPIVKSTIGYSGAELANIVNQAALLATNENAPYVSLEHLNRAQELITLGAVNTAIKMSEREKEVTAYHEAGHALAWLLCENTTHTLYKVTIVPHARALGLTTALPDQERYSYTKEELLTRIKVSLGGRIAEELQFGIIGTGAHNDFEQATNIARQMVCTYGMTEALGPIAYLPNQKGNHSQYTAELIDKEIHTIITTAYKEIKALLSKNKDKLDILAHALLEKETVGQEEIYELLGIAPL